MFSGACAWKKLGWGSWHPAQLTWGFTRQFQGSVCVWRGCGRGMRSRVPWCQRSKSPAQEKREPGAQRGCSGATAMGRASWLRATPQTTRHSVLRSDAFKVLVSHGSGIIYPNAVQAPQGSRPSLPQTLRHPGAMSLLAFTDQLPSKAQACGAEAILGARPRAPRLEAR